MLSHVKVKLISLQPAPGSLERIQRTLPQAHVFPASDFRSRTPDELYREGKITLSTVDTLKRGRRWHKELARVSAVGLFDSHVRALRSTANTSYLLLCEEDCQLSPRFAHRLRALLGSGVDFDVAIFGPDIHGHTDAVAGLPGWRRLRGSASFWCLHCVLYSPLGREKASRLLEYPIDAQLDAILGMHALEGDIDLILETDATASQSFHPSTLQDTCVICFMSRHTLACIVAACTVLVLGVHVRAQVKLRACRARCPVGSG